MGSHRHKRSLQTGLPHRPTSLTEDRVSSGEARAVFITVTFMTFGP